MKIFAILFLLTGSVLFCQAQVSSEDALIDGGTYYVTQTIDGCTSDYLVITVNEILGRLRLISCDWLFWVWFAVAVRLNLLPQVLE